MRSLSMLIDDLTCFRVECFLVDRKAYRATDEHACSLIDDLGSYLSAIPGCLRWAPTRRGVVVDLTESEQLHEMARWIVDQFRDHGRLMQPDTVH